MEKENSFDDLTKLETPLLHRREPSVPLITDSTAPPTSTPPEPIIENLRASATISAGPPTPETPTQTDELRKTVVITPPPAVQQTPSEPQPPQKTPAPTRAQPPLTVDAEPKPARPSPKIPRLAISDMSAHSDSSIVELDDLSVSSRNAGKDSDKTDSRGGSLSSSAQPSPRIPRPKISIEGAIRLPPNAQEITEKQALEGDIGVSSLPMRRVHSTIALDSTPIGEIEVDSLEQSLSFLIKLAVTFHKYGAPANRLEYNLWEVAQTLGINAQFTALPTFLMVTFGDPGSVDSFSRVIRLEQTFVQCEKLYLVDRLIDEVAREKITFRQAVIELDKIIEKTPSYSVITHIAAVAAVGAGSAPLFFGGGWLEMIISLILGGVVGILGFVATKSHNFSLVAEVFQAMIVGFVSILLHEYACFHSTVLASLVWIFPGITITIAIRELATRNLLSGAARMFNAFMISLKLGFGLAIGASLPFWLTVEFDATCEPPFGTLSPWFNIIFFFVTVGGFCILLNAYYHQWPGMILVSAIAYFSSRILEGFFTGAQRELIPVVSSFVVTFAGNLYSRFSPHPGIIIIFSGFLFLMPGSIGVRGAMKMLIERDFISGIQFGFNMIMIGLSLTMGSFVANLLVVPGRSIQHKLF